VCRYALARYITNPNDSASTHRTPYKQISHSLGECAPLVKNPWLKQFNVLWFKISHYFSKRTHGHIADVQYIATN